MSQPSLNPARAPFDWRKPVFVLEGLNGISTAFYFNYLFFFLKAQYDVTNLQNLMVCALNGFTFMCSAYYGGKFGQKFGYITAIKLGSVIMAAALVASAFVTSIFSLMVLMVIWTLGMCFTWPNLEGLTCDKQPASRLPKLIGLYNVIWSGASAIAYFTGGAIAETFGWNSIFYIPAAFCVIQLGVAIWYEPRWKAVLQAPAPRPDGHVEESHPEGALFLKMAWVANPFAYIAINAVIPLIPDLANRLGLSPKTAGFFCSIWFFARTFTFVVLAFWERWHYKFSYLLWAYVGTIVCFAAMLLLNSLALVVLIQLLFGWCIGLIYYSSLYYSMHVGETKGEHGGFHEAAIGAGIFAGPAIGAASLHFFPGTPQSGVIGVSLALTAGLAGLLKLRKSKAPSAVLDS